MRFYSEGRISDLFERIQSTIRHTIEGESENYILNVNEITYCEHIASQHYLNFPELHFDQTFVDSFEKEIPSELFPRMSFVESGKKYKRDVITFHVPFTGDITLLRYSPASRFSLNSGGEASIKDGCLVFEYINFSNNPQEIKRDHDSRIHSLQSNYTFLKEDCEGLNSNLATFCISALNERKQKILNKNNLLSSLGVPIRQKANTPNTFSVPAPETREKIVIKPVVYEKGFKPEPSLDIENYNKILNLISDVGKAFERMPSTYSGKEEEHLRDHILLILSPNFENGTATGETFNFTGKTDILLRYENTNVFIAECKFWKGEKQYLETIDQLLGYLTWRDSKAAVIMFVRNKAISGVLDTIETSTSKHRNYLGFVNKQDENWFNYRMHLNDDPNREVKLAVMAIHIPD